MIKTFKEAFSSNIHAAQDECVCGQTYHHPDINQWDFTDSELHWLEENSIELESAIEYVEFNDERYIKQCNCWHDKAQRIIDFLNDNKVGIAKYLNGERARKIKEAEQMEIINILSDKNLGDANDKPF